MNYSVFIRVTGWLASLTGVSGAFILALAPETWFKWAFMPWLISNLSWLLHSYLLRIWSQWIMQAGYLFVTYIGLFRHFGPEALMAAVSVSLAMLVLIYRLRDHPCLKRAPLASATPEIET